VIQFASLFIEHTKAFICGKPCNLLDHDTNLVSTVTCPAHCEFSDWIAFFCDKVSSVATSTRTIAREPLNGGNSRPELQRIQHYGPPACETGDWTTQECSAETCTAVRTREQLYPIRGPGNPCSPYKKTPCKLDAVLSPGPSGARAAPQDPHARDHFQRV
ncbi:hypothetical protein H310_15060, partial [Aphanomyces invadans]